MIEPWQYCRGWELPTVIDAEKCYECGLCVSLCPSPGEFNEKHHRETAVNEEAARGYIGSSDFATRMLYDKIKPRIDPNLKINIKL